MRISLPIKLMASYLIVAGLIFAPSLWFLRSSLESSLQQAEARALQAPAEAVRDRLTDVPTAELDRRLREYSSLLQLRITYINRDGVVAADTQVPHDQLARVENHSDRPEVREALAGRFGYAHRVSATVGLELIYGAVPFPAAGTPRGVLRVAREALPLHAAVSNALLALRMATGVGVSAALGLSLIAALFISTPLRRMRDAARAFAQSRWVPMKPVRSGDELEELSLALAELGHNLREQLVQVGGQESLLIQAVASFPLPAVVLSPHLQPLVVNGAFRKLAGITADNERERIEALIDSPRLAAARDAVAQSGLPTEVVFVPVAADPETTVQGTLLPLARPNAPSLWLLVTRDAAPDAEASGPEAVQRALHGAETMLERLWSAHPALRPALARLRAFLDDAAAASGHPEMVGVEPIGVVELIRRSTEGLRLLYPNSSDKMELDLGETDCKIAESAGLAARTVRMFLGGALWVLPPSRTLTVTLEVNPTEVKLLIEGAAPPDLRSVGELARALGGDVGRVPNREREAAWLSLPRA